MVAEAPASAATAAEGKIFVVTLFFSWENRVFPGKFSFWIFNCYYGYPFGSIA